MEKKLRTFWRHAVAHDRVSHRVRFPVQHVTHASLLYHSRVWYAVVYVVVRTYCIHQNYSRTLNGGQLCGVIEHETFCVRFLVEVFSVLGRVGMAQRPAVHYVLMNLRRRWRRRLAEQRETESRACVSCVRACLCARAWAFVLRSSQCVCAPKLKLRALCVCGEKKSFHALIGFVADNATRICVCVCVCVQNHLIDAEPMRSFPNVALIVRPNVFHPFSTDCLFVVCARVARWYVCMCVLWYVSLVDCQMRIVESKNHRVTAMNQLVLHNG